MLTKHKTDALLTIAGVLSDLQRVIGSLPFARDEGSLLCVEWGEHQCPNAYATQPAPAGSICFLEKARKSLNLFMDHLEYIREIDDRNSVWKIKVPGESGFTWYRRPRSSKSKREANLSQHSKPGSTIENAGKDQLRQRTGEEEHQDRCVDLLSRSFRKDRRRYFAFAHPSFQSARSKRISAVSNTIWKTGESYKAGLPPFLIFCRPTESPVILLIVSIAFSSKDPVILDHTILQRKFRLAAAWVNSPRGLL